MRTVLGRATSVAKMEVHSPHRCSDCAERTERPKRRLDFQLEHLLIVVCVCVCSHTLVYMCMHMSTCAKVSDIT